MRAALINQVGYYLLPNGLPSHFTVKELGCRCEFGCGFMALAEITIVSLEQLRKDLGGHPLTGVSGVRCPRHNANEGGAPKSKHVPVNGVACAADLRHTKGTVAMFLAAWAIPAFRGFGMGRTKFHVDPREQEHRSSWTYGLGGARPEAYIDQVIKGVWT